MSPISLCKLKMGIRSSSCSRSGSGRSSSSGCSVKTTKSAATTPDVTRPLPTADQLKRQLKQPLSIQLKELERQRDELKGEVLNLAEANYAREPEFVRQRARIRQQAEEVARVVKQLELKYMGPILAKLDEVQNKLAEEARRHEEMSEAMAHRFLLNTSCGGGENGFESGDANSTQIIGDSDRGAGATDPSLAESYEQFIGNYIKLRKETSKKRLLADRLAKERSMLLSNITQASQLVRRSS